MLVAAAGLEIALHFSHVKTGESLTPVLRIWLTSRLGWRVRGTVAATTGIYHYIYVRGHVHLPSHFVINLFRRHYHQ